METAARSHTVYAARWGVLVAYALLALVLQLQWLTFAPIAREAMTVYGASQFQVDFLSLIFMGVFVVMCIPASYVIDRWGIRVGVGLGAVLMAVFGIVKGLGASSYTVVAAAQVGLAVAQPLVLNATTKLAAQWFPMKERATAVGIASLAQFLGIIVVMLVTPALVAKSDAGIDLRPVMLLYGGLSAGAAVLVLLLVRERPPTPPGEEPAEARPLSWAAVRAMLGQRDMRLVMGLFLIGLGVFNALSTCIDQLCALSGLSADDTGMVGGIMFITGIVGAAILPAISDRRRRRKPFLVLAMAVMTPALLGLTLASGYLPLLLASAVLGFFLLGAGAPIGFQYAAEVSYPAPESMSQGAILLVGQISGILFIVGINLVGIIPFMWLFVGLGALATLIAAAMRESPRV
ncbi:MAG: MFS transporter [Myxococcota bacterium]